jgi:hypothetical protein
MKRPDDPVRSVDDPDVPAAWREALAHGQLDAPSAEQLQRLFRRLKVASAMSAGQDRGGFAAPARRRNLPARFVLAASFALAWVAVASALAANAFLRGRTSTEPQERSGPAARASALEPNRAWPNEPQPPRGDEPASAPPASPAEVPAAAPAEPPRARGERKSRPAVLGDSDAAGESRSAALAEEVALLRRAQQELAAAPARALSLAHEHARRYPNGALREERELITIVALLETGSIAQAQQRAAAFRHEHPHSVHVRRLEAVLRDHNDRPSAEPSKQVDHSPEPRGGYHVQD